ncbi:MAG: efflux RND transporter periplasmic adaptor subunit [Cyclobacteriaceae bacterium]|nr:efflux RND transporter periplasmic adaptor subunit [Cyclobacteriaceae bacterium]
MQARNIFIGILLTACSAKQQTVEPDPQQLRNEVPPTEVQIVPARKAPFEYLIHAVGKIQPQSDIELQGQTSGVVEKVWVQNGMQVLQGQTIVTLVNAHQTLARDKARLLLQEREIAYQDAMLGYSNSDSVRHKQARQNIRISSGLAAAEIAFKEAQLAWEQTIVKAPVNGIISDLEVHAGSTITANQTICRIHSTRELLVATELLEADALLLKPGMVAELKALGMDKTIAAIVYQINPRVAEKTNLIKVLLKVTGTAQLLPGMTTQLTIKVPHQKVIVIPREAVVIRSGRHVVFTFENRLAKWNYVTVGRENGKEIEILDGLKEGQQVIITNNLQLAHDAVVKLN